MAYHGSAGSNPVAAGYLNDLAGEPPCVIGSQEHQHVGNVLGRAQAPQRDRGQQRRLKLGGDVACLDRARRHGVHRDAQWTDLDGHAARVGLRRRFARAIGDLAGEVLRRVGADVEDASSPRVAGLILIE